MVIRSDVPADPNMPLDRDDPNNPRSREERGAAGAPPPPVYVPDILQFFAFDHLPDKLKTISQPFGVLAAIMVQRLPDNAERQTMLRKLLEAKDAAVRAMIYKAAADTKFNVMASAGGLVAGMAPPPVPYPQRGETTAPVNQAGPPTEQPVVNQARARVGLDGRPYTDPPQGYGR